MQAIEISRLQMSSDEETPPETETPKRNDGLFVTLKFLELFLIIICIGLIDDPANTNRMWSFMPSRSAGMSYATLGAFLIYTSIYLIMRLFNVIQSWKLSALMSFLGATLFIVCTIMLFRDWSSIKDRISWTPHTHRLDFLCGAASVSLVLFLLYTLDCILTIRFGLKGYFEY